MSEESKDQINQWLKKLERESWQLELLVSAFTIFLLLQAIGSFAEFLTSLQFQYNLGGNILSFIFIFFSLVNLSIKALTMFLVFHLLLRGFWIGAIGLRSVQSTIHFEQLNYSNFFTEKLKKKVTSLDNLVIMLDEICSLMFSFAFLVISIIIAFGLYLVFLGVTILSLSAMADLTAGGFEVVFRVVSGGIFLIILISGLIYLVDYFTLGFFKKFKWFSKIYYPIYRFYGLITLAFISKSIYYNLISKFSKKRIRLVYLVIGVLMLFSYLIDYNQYQFYPEANSEYELVANQYDNLRGPKSYIYGSSIQSNVIKDSFVQLFIRYHPQDNKQIQSNCPELLPAKQDGFNWRFQLEIKDLSFFIKQQDYASDDKAQLLQCLSNLYQISVNDSIYQGINYYFYDHPAKQQKGIMAMISTAALAKGENTLVIRKTYRDEEGKAVIEDHSHIPFWLE
jgi:hypothetical protein